MMGDPVLKKRMTVIKERIAAAGFRLAKSVDLLERFNLKSDLLTKKFLPPKKTI